MSKKKTLAEMYELDAGGRMLDYGHEKSDSDEGKMAKSALGRLSRLATDLDHMLYREDDLPQWVHYKISTSADRIQSVHNYLSDKISRMQHPMREGDVDQNQDGKNDFDDVQIARMKASGMSIDDIKAKHPELFEAKKKKKRPGNPNYYKGTRKSNKEMEREINKCAKEPRPKSCYDEWTADKTYDKGKKKKNEVDELDLVRELVSEIVLQEKKGGLSKKTRETLKKKAEKANMPLGALTSVYRKGLAAWLTGHRQGVPQHAWAMARVNSFIRGGKTRSVDKAEWKKVQKHRKKKK